MALVALRPVNVQSETTPPSMTISICGAAWRASEASVAIASHSNVQPFIRICYVFTIG